MGSVAILAAELQSARRQHAALQYLLATAESHGGPHAASSTSAAHSPGKSNASGYKGDAAAAAEMQELRAQLRGFAVATAQQIADLRALDEPDAAPAMAHKQHSDDKGSDGTDNSVPRASLVKFGFDRDDSGRSELTSESAPGAHNTAAAATAADADAQSALVAGNAAVNIARVERVRARRLAAEVVALRSEREQLLEQLDAAGGATTTAADGARGAL